MIDDKTYYSSYRVNGKNVANRTISMKNLDWWLLKQKEDDKTNI